MHILLRVAEEAAGAADATRLVLPEIDELIWGTVAFLVFFVVMAKMVFPGMRKALKAREQAIRGELEKAEQARLDAEELMEEYRRQLADARAQADRIVKDAQAAAEDVRRDLVARADDEARQIVERARAEAGAERDRLLGQLRRDVADLSIQGAQRVVAKELADPEAQRQLVEQFIAQVGSMGSNN